MLFRIIHTLAQQCFNTGCHELHQVYRVGYAGEKCDSACQLEKMSIQMNTSNTFSCKSNVCNKRILCGLQLGHLMLHIINTISSACDIVSLTK